MGYLDMPLIAFHFDVCMPYRIIKESMIWLGESAEAGFTVL